MNLRVLEAKTIIETAVNSIIIIDQSGLITLFNPAAEKLFGWKESEVTGKNVSILMPEPHASQHDSYIRNYLNAKQASIIGIGRDVLAQRKNGELFHAHLSVAHTENTDSDSFFVGFITDITDHKNREEELKLAKEQAEVANEAKSLFLAKMSHEIRTPMNGILGSLQLLLNTPLTENQKQFVNMSYESGASLLQLINDILDFSKIEAGKLEIEQFDFNLEHEIDAVLELISHTAAQKSIKLNKIDETPLPEIVIGDPLRLRQVLLNLINNAIKFTATGGSVSVHTRFLQQAGEPTLSISVIDTGIGMSHDVLETIFNNFSQVDDSSTRNFDGAGLGLAITKQLVLMMGGDIKVSSRVGEGSSFTFTLPIKISESDSVESAPMAQDPSFLSQQCVELPQFSADVLVVEDNRMNQVIAQDVLESLGCEVVIAENGVHALDILSQQKFDLIFMDCQMPELDGFETTRRIRAQESEDEHIPIIALTANAYQADQKQCYASGMDDYISKPFLVEDLANTMSKYLPLPESTS